MILKFGIICIIHVCGIYSYQRYAKPIELLKPDENGVYTYDMTVAKKLTMSYNNDNKALHATPVDYDYTTQTWTKRDPNQLKPCFMNYTMNQEEDDMNRLDNVLVVDGLHKRVITINGEMPGEPIVVPYMSEVWLRVTNKVLLDSMTIHVHGIDKHGMWYMDGVAFVQQCPIMSTNSFEYRFIADNKGTHWYHGHMQTDRSDGIAGGFIVVDPADRSIPAADGKRLTPSREYFLLLQDWSTKPGDEAWMDQQDKTLKWMYGFEKNEKCWQLTRTADGGNVGGAIPISAILLNDKGWYDQDVVKSEPFNLPLERFQIKNNEELLFRIVNGGVAQELMLYFEGHQMTVVAADGEDVVPMKVDRLVVFPGERYDVSVRGLDSPAKRSFRIQVETLQRYFWDWSTIPVDYGFGFLEYEDATLPENTTPLTPSDLLHPECTQSNKCSVLNCPFEVWGAQPNLTCISYDKLENLKHQDIEKEILSAVGFNGGFEEHFINMHHDSQMNQFMFQFPSGIPYYHSNDMDTISKDCAQTACANNPESDNDNTCRCFFNLEHKLGNIVQITIYNMGLGGAMGTGYAHPFHLHGHHFYVMKVGWPSYNASGFIENLNPDIDCDSPNDSCNGKTWRNKAWANGAIEGMNVKNPTLRDTINLPVGGYITIRFRAVNPGWWFAHCHLELHLMGGTGYAYKVGDDSQIYMPPSNFPKDCGSFRVNKLPELVLPSQSAQFSRIPLISLFFVIFSYVLN